MMPFDALRRFFAPPAPQPAGLDALVRAEAAAFASWLDARKAAGADAIERVDSAMEAEKAARTDAEPPAELLSQCAAFVGERLRESHGGAWQEDARFGLVLAAPGGIGHAMAFPLAMAEKKWELGAKLKLAQFFANLPAGFERERTRSGYAANARALSREEVAARVTATPAGRETWFAQASAEAFRTFWRARFGADVALSLQGVREAERLLRSQFLLLTLREETLVQMGFFAGEVARGLYQGEWDFAEARAGSDPARCALRWPELPLYPVGRTLRVLTERPEKEALDDFIRTVPSARSELRKRTQEKPE